MHKTVAERWISGGHERALCTTEAVYGRVASTTNAQKANRQIFCVTEEWTI